MYLVFRQYAIPDGFAGGCLTYGLRYARGGKEDFTHSPVAHKIGGDVNSAF